MAECICHHERVRRLHSESLILLEIAGFGGVIDIGIDHAGLTALTGLAGMVFGVSWPLFRNRTVILSMQTLGSTLFAFHWLLKGDGTATVLTVMSVIQSLAAIPLGSRPGFRYVYLGTLPVIAVLLASTWSGTPSVFAALGTAVVSLGRYQLDTLLFRVILMAAGPFWFSHNVLVESYPAMAADIVSLVINAVTLYRLLGERRHDTLSAVPVRQEG